MVAALAPAPGRAASPSQTVEGTITVPLAHEGCGFVMALLETGLRAGSIVGHRFTVEPGTRGTRFVLRADEVPADLDLVFFGPRIKGFATRGLDAEYGRVPRRAKTAIVCMFAGAGAHFIYRAGSALRATDARV
jgi:hypothetical protein